MWVATDPVENIAVSILDNFTQVESSFAKVVTKHLLFHPNRLDRFIDD